MFRLLSVFAEGPRLGLLALRIELLQSKIERGRKVQQQLPFLRIKLQSDLDRLYQLYASD